MSKRNDLKGARLSKRLSQYERNYENDAMFDRSRVAVCPREWNPFGEHPRHATPPPSAVLLPGAL